MYPHDITPFGYIRVNYTRNNGMYQKMFSWRRTIRTKNNTGAALWHQTPDYQPTRWKIHRMEQQDSIHHKRRKIKPWRTRHPRLLANLRVNSPSWLPLLLSHIRSLRIIDDKYRSVKLQQTRIEDLELPPKFFSRTNNGVSMNLIAFRSPTHCYRADSLLRGICEYSYKGRSWRWEIPKDLLWRETLNILEFMASVIWLWIDIIENILPPY